MPRIARVVVPRFPHHLTQRGNRRQETFFCDDDYEAYLEFAAAAKRRVGVDIWAYCLMPNHVHLVAVPEDEVGLADFCSYAHQRYTRKINFREDWRGHLWQGRFFSNVMDERYLAATVRYIELNPVRAGLCDRADDWPWSSVHAHKANADTDVVSVAPMLERFPDWEAYLGLPLTQTELDDIRKHSATGKPIGSTSFVDALEAITGRRLHSKNPGPQPKK